MRSDSVEFLESIPVLWKDRSEMYRYLAEHGIVPQGGIGAEIGVYCADNSADMKASFNPKHMYLIDEWLAFPKSLTAEPSRGKQVAQEIRFKHVEKRFGKDVTVMRTNSARAAYAFKPGYLDWVYIDGDHHYAPVFADLCAYSVRVKSGGIVMCHDMCGNVCRGDVVDALNDFSRRMCNIDLIGITGDHFPSVAFRVVETSRTGFW
jgi:hypothetical protein